MAEDRTITIDDVARLAGVSLASPRRKFVQRKLKLLSLLNLVNLLICL